VTVCGFHHDLETRRAFGDALVDRCVREKRERVRIPRSPSAGDAVAGTAGDASRRRLRGRRERE